MTEIRWERGQNGCLMAWVQREPNRVLLRRYADVVTETFGAEPRDRVDGGDMVFWDFVAGATCFTLHLERQTGIAIMANDPSPSSEKLLRQIAEHLASGV